MTAAWGRAGAYTLVELLVAMVLFQLGLLGSAGLVVLASRTLRGAIELERAVTETETLADSLTRSPWQGSGQRPLPPYVVRWMEAGSGMRVEALSESGDTVLVSVTIPWRPDPPE